MGKYRKVFITIFILILLIVAPLFLTACFPIENNDNNKENTSENHVHEYEIIRHTEPTCIKVGETVYQCKCGDFYIETVKAFGHELTHYEGQDNTCQTGWTEYDACSRCSYSTKKVLQAKHQYKSYSAKSATCFEDGNNAYSECELCGYSTKIVIPASHGKMIHISAVKATCEEDGHSAYDYCSVCGYSSNKVEYQALGHNLTTYEYKPATCYEDGNFEYESCSRCSYTTYQKIAGGHQYTYYEGKEPTCLLDGYEPYYCCNRCNDTNFTLISSLGHDIEYHEKKQATCYASGNEAYVSCKRCSYTTRKEIQQLEHDYVLHEGKTPTCSDDGWSDYYTCKNCSYTSYNEISALGHNLTHHSGKNATCLEGGYNAYDTCDRCSYSTYLEIDALGHSINSVSAKEPTCVDIGNNAYEYCSRCNYTTYKKISALGHSISHYNGKSATCVDDGYEPYISCNRCTFSTYQKIDKLGHSITHYDEKIPTCEEAGHNAYDVCSRCSYSTYEYKKALGHDLVHHDGQVATYSADGYEEYDTCKRCSYTTYKVIPKLEHTFVYYSGKPATCLESGYKDYAVCSKCQYSTYEEIPAFGHSITKYSAKEATCTQEGNNAYEKCSRCTYTTKQTSNALGHNYINHSAKSATCTEIGYNAYQTCSRCSYSSYVEIKALGHNLTHHNGKTVTCLEVGYNAYDTCSRCSYSTYYEISALGHDLIHYQGKSVSCTEDGYSDYDKCNRLGCDYTTYKVILSTGHKYSSGSGVKSCTVCGKVEQVLSIRKNGSTSYKLVYDTTNTTIKTASNFINSELNKTVGWKFSVNSTVPQYNASSLYISIGNNAYSSSAGLVYHSTQGTDYQIAVKGNSIFVLGDDYAMNFAVYGLLNVLIGYEKFSVYSNGVGEEIAFNNSKTIELGVSQIEKTVTKDIAYTVAITQGNLYSNAKGASLQNNSSMGYTYMAQMGGGSSNNDDGVTASLQYQVRGGHNSLGYFPLALYNDSSLTSTYHPEWFAHDSDASGNNVYRSSPKQVCYYSLWNDSRALDRAFTVVKNHTSWNTIYFSNMDTGGDCSCKYCKNNLAYQYIKFLNALATKMANDSETEHMTLCGMLYKENSMQPPVDKNGKALITPNDNVELLFAFEQADYYAGLSEIDNQLLEKWSKVCSRFRFWTYCQKTSYGMFFYDDFTNMQKLFETLYKYGAYSIQDEGYESSSTHTNFNNLRVYLVKELSKNTGYNMTDAEALEYYNNLTTKFFNQYFDIASEDMRAVFEFQKTKAQYMYNNWLTGANIFQNAYYKDGSYRFKNTQSQITGTNDIGNNNIGTYSSWGYHLYAGNSMHGNRYAWSMVYSKNDFLTLFSYFTQAFIKIEESSLSSSRKEMLKSRVELEKIGVMYQFMFIYENTFAKGNSSMDSTLNTTDIQAMGYTSLDGAKLDFIALCKKYGISNANYNSVSNLATIWGLDEQS